MKVQWKRFSNVLVLKKIYNLVCLLLYEKDGHLTWYDQPKSKEFLGDPDAHFKNKKIVNFDII